MPLETPASHSKPLPRSQGFATRHSGGVHVLPPRSEGAPAARTQRRRESCEVQHRRLLYKPERLETSAAPDTRLTTSNGSETGRTSRAPLLDGHGSGRTQAVLQ